MAIVEHSELITVEEASRVMHCTPQTVRNAVLAGRLNGERIGGRLFTWRHECEALGREDRDRDERTIRLLFEPIGPGRPVAGETIEARATLPPPEPSVHDLLRDKPIK